MKILNKIMKGSMIAGAVLACSASFAGNEDRVGEAGASQLLVNPWARSSAWADAGVASVNGLEATFTNVAGLAFTDKTQIKVNYTNWLGSANIDLYSAGLAQRISDQDVISVAIQAFGFGEVYQTTVDLPEPTGAVFTPRQNIVNVGYAREFSNSIYGGFNLKVLTESVANMSASGVAFDAGIRYVTGEQDHVKFGISLKNVGPTMQFDGDGLATPITYQTTGGSATLEQRANDFEMPSQLVMGVSYDFLFSETNKLTAAGSFTANSFSNDQYRFGLDYGMATEKAAFNVRAGYVLEKDIFSVDNRTNALSGLTAGFSVDALVGESKAPIGIEYCYRMSPVFGGINSFGITLSLK